MAYCTTDCCSLASPVANQDSTSIIHWLLGSGPDKRPLKDSWARRAAGPRPPIPFSTPVSGLKFWIVYGDRGNLDLLRPIVSKRKSRDRREMIIDWTAFRSIVAVLCTAV